MDSLLERIIEIKVEYQPKMGEIITPTPFKQCGCCCETFYGNLVFSGDYCTDCQKQINTGFLYAIKGGQSWNGGHRDKGQVIHALKWNPPVDVPSIKSKAVCGTQPGYRSYGWIQTTEKTEPTCARCLKLVKKQKKT